jgi:hypothetical protein
MTAETPKRGRPIATSTDPRTGRTLSSVRDPDYWQALGEFIEAFASAETMLFQLLILSAKMRHDSARALLSGIHVDQMISLVRRVWQVMPLDADVTRKLSGVLEQFKIISDMRNSMVHYVSFVTRDKGRVSSNVTRALTDRHLHERRISPTIMQDMTNDIHKISDHLVYAVSATANPKIARDDLASRFPALAASWRYKPPEDQSRSVPTRRQRRRQQ